MSAAEDRFYRKAHAAHPQDEIKVPPLILQPNGLPVHYRTVDDIELEFFNKKWIVEGLIEEGRAYQFFGQWKSGKTLALMDCCCSIAMGMTWAERRVEPSLIIWIASESCEDVTRRLAAWKLRHGVSGSMNFLIREKPIHLDKVEFAKALHNEIQSIVKMNPGLSVVCVIDTVARSLSGELPENGEGLIAFANNVLDEVVRPLGCACVAVHHSGHGDKSRSRGHSAFPAALDGSVMVEVERQPNGPSFVNVSTVEMRSTSGGDTFQFRIDVQEINGSDNFGNSLSEPVLFYVGEAPAKDNKPKPQGKNQTLVFKELMKRSKEFDGGKVPRLILRAELLESGEITAEGFHDAVNGLLTKFLIRDDCGYLEVIP